MSDMDDETVHRYVLEIDAGPGGKESATRKWLSSVLHQAFGDDFKLTLSPQRKTGVKKVRKQ